MAPKSQRGVRLRPADLARAHGLSTQAVRNYEAAGILPAADRGANGYRTYTPLHAQALHAFLALVPGHGHRTATAVMQAVGRDAVDDALRLVEGTSAQLLEDRRTLEAVEAAVADLAPTVEAAFAAASADEMRQLLELLRVEVHVVDRQHVRLTELVGSTVELSRWSPP